MGGYFGRVRNFAIRETGPPYKTEKRWVWLQDFGR